MVRWLALIVAVACAGAASAEPPKSSPRPLPRPGLAAAPVAGLPTPVEPAVVMPALAQMPPPRRPAQPIAAAAPDLITPAAEPAKPRKGLLGLIAPRAKPTKKALASRKGSVCGQPGLKGKTLPRITSKTKGCGVEAPVSLTAVDGLRLSTPATIDCETATALQTWVRKGLRANVKGEPVGLTVAASYACRTRNNVRGAKISEHGRGNAIDISGVTLANGKELTVRRNFKSLRRAYKAGCGIFGTTLGPGSDGYHEDHMHFDTARQRGGGAYCR